MVFYELIDNLHDPVKMTRSMRDEEFLKYVEIREREEKTDTAKLNDIKIQFYYLHRYQKQEFLDKVWEAVEDKIVENAGLAEFTLDYDGASSEFFFPWLVTIQNSPSAALEMAYGYGYDLAGDWKKVPEYDPIMEFVRNDPTFVFNRERQLAVAKLVTKQREMCRLGELTQSESWRIFTVADLGAGRMAWARHHGFIFTKNCAQRIYAYDRDPTIDPDKLFTGSAEENGVLYSRGDIMESLAGLPSDKLFDVIILQGVASYYPIEIFEKLVLRPVCEKLKVGGKFFFDLQLDCPYYRRSVAIFDWPKMRLYEGYKEVLEVIEGLRLKLHKDGIKLMTSYGVDLQNTHKSSIMITLTKV